MRRLPILMYHKVDVRPPGTLVPHHYVSPKRFGRHVGALVSFGFHTVRLATVLDAFDGQTELPLRAVSLTFDDGYLNFDRVAARVLSSHGQTGTVFAVSSLLGKTNEWDTRLGDVEEPLMDGATLKGLVAQGFEVGSHSATHARLTECSDTELATEALESQRTLSDLLGQDVPVFCYPYGAQDSRVRDAVRQAGYRAACSVEKGWNSPQTDRFRWRRINVRSDTSTPVLWWKLWRQSRPRRAGD